MDIGVTVAAAPEQIPKLGGMVTVGVGLIVTLTEAFAGQLLATT